MVPLKVLLGFRVLWFWLPLKALLGFRVLGFRALKIEGLGFFKGVGLFWA